MLAPQAETAAAHGRHRARRATSCSTYRCGGSPAAPAVAVDQVEQKRRPAPRGLAARVAIEILEAKKADLIPRGLTAAAEAIAGLMEPPPRPDTIRRYVGARFRELTAAAARTG